MHRIALDPRKIRDISPEVLDANGRLRVLPASYWRTTTMQERALFGHTHGIYSFPTTELIAYLNEVIGERSAIEIGAGHGVLASALGIRATDNHQQAMPKYRRIYQITGQPTIRYGVNVANYSAHSAVRRFKPDVVIGCWVTHLYDPRRHYAGGNEIGVDEDDVLSNCLTYIAIGDESVHRHKKIWQHPHVIEYPDWLFSRASSGMRQFIATWTR